MENPLLAYPNRIDASLVNGGLWRTVRPLTLLQDKSIPNFARSENDALTSTKFRVDLQANYAIRAMALAGTNLSTVAQWRASYGAQMMDITFDSDTISPLVTSSGGVNGTRFDSSGEMVAAEAPRITYDPTPTGSQNSHACLGLLVEKDSLNKFLNSLLDGTNLTTQTVVLPASVHTVSFYGTGTLTLTGASTAGPLVGVSDTAPVSLTFTPSAGGVTFTRTGTVKWANLEAGNIRTSFIPTGAFGVTRTADQNYIDSTRFTFFYAPAASAPGTIYAEFMQPALDATVNHTPISVNDADPVLRGVNISVVAGVVTGESTVAGVAQAAMATSANAAGTVCKAAMAYATNDFAISKDGAAVVTDVAGTMPAAMTQIGIGYRAKNGIRYLNGYVRRIAYWNTRRSNADLVAMTGASGPESINTFVKPWTNALQFVFEGDTPADWGMQYQAQLTFNAATARFWCVEIDDTMNAAGYVQIGRFFMAGAFQPGVGPDRGIRVGVDDLSTSLTTPTGQQFDTERARPRKARFVLSWNTQAEMNKIHEMQRQLGTTGELLWVPDPSDPDYSQRYGLLGRLRVLDEFEFPNSRQRRIPFELKEKI